MVSRPPSGTIPDAPGSYQFFDSAGRVIYVGKAKSLRSRLNSYFTDKRSMHPRTAQMVSTAETVEWVQVDNDVEALMLEYNLIKQHRPRFNIRLVDDKSYPFLALTLSDTWPRAQVMRGKKRKGTRYFGPYAHAYAIRETLDQLLRIFPIRTCSDSKLTRHERLGKPCLLFHIEKCSGPCVDEISSDDYKNLVQELCNFLSGDTDPVIHRLEGDMQEAAKALEFEQAARVRDRLATVRKAIAKQQMVADSREDVDVIGLAGDELEAVVFVLIIRNGLVLGRRSIVVDTVESLDEGGLIDRILEGIYDDPPVQGMPKTVLVTEESTDRDLYEAWLSSVRGSKVEIRVPKRGAKRELLETANRNAKEEFNRHRLKRASDHNSRAKALNELQTWLGLPESPLRIECYDMSHLQGTNYVGSMVVVEDGLAAKGEYRRFKIQSVEQNDDYAAMEEVLRRRLSNYVKDKEKPLTERGRFQYPPQLLLVDGGKGQLGVAKRVVAEFGLEKEIPVAALAKQFEEVFIPDQKDPVVIPRKSEALYLLQRLRDESHRFAVSYHRQLRKKEMTKSVLDDIAGLGPARKKRLVKELGGISAVRRADNETLRKLKWLPNTVADAVHEKIHGFAPLGTEKSRRG